MCDGIRLTLAEVRRRTPSAEPAWGPRGTTPRLTVRGTTAGAPPPPPPPPHHTTPHHTTPHAVLHFPVYKTSRRLPIGAFGAHSFGFSTFWEWCSSYCRRVASLTNPNRHRPAAPTVRLLDGCCRLVANRRFNGLRATRQRSTALQYAADVQSRGTPLSLFVFPPYPAHCPAGSQQAPGLSAGGKGPSIKALRPPSTPSPPPHGTHLRSLSRDRRAQPQGLRLAKAVRPRAVRPRRGPVRLHAPLDRSRSGPRVVFGVRDVHHGTVLWGHLRYGLIAGQACAWHCGRADLAE